MPQLVVLDPADNTRQRVPLSTASEAAYDDTGEQLFFVRPAFHNNVTKRYVGGTARDVWKFAAGGDEAVELTGDYGGESHSPMWWNGRVYFVTDRDGTMNIWSMHADGGDLRQHTEHAGWDVRDPDLSAGRIVYQLGADLWMYDIATDAAAVVPITLASDFDQLREKWETEPVQYLTSAHLHPRGKSVVLTARGRVFVAPAGDGRLVQATRDEGVRYRDVVFMPDGSLVGLSDATGEFEFVRIPANGIGAPEALSDDGTVLRFRGRPSPDGAWIAFTDMNRDLSLLNTETGETRVISENREGIGGMSWAPDSRWLAYSMTAMNSFQQIKLYNVDTEVTTAVTSDRTNSTSPAWGPDGGFLYFASDRNLRSVVGSPWGPRAPEPYFDRPIKLYEVALRRGLRSPFRPADELMAARGGPRSGGAASSGNDDAQHAEGQAEGQDAEDASTTEAIEIDLDGIERRLREVPVEPGTYAALQANERALFYLSRVGAGSAASANLMALPFDSDDADPVTVVERARQAELSLDGEKLLVRRGDDFFILDARPRAAGNQLDDGKIDLDAWAFRMNVREDWRQMMVDAWRMERDYFYDPDMHGVDWEGTLARYLPLVDRLTTRAELSDLIGRFVGDKQRLGGTGELVYVHDPVDLALGRHGVGAAGPDDLVHPPYGCGAEGHGRHPLGAAHGVDLAQAEQVGRGQDVRMGAAVGPGGRGHADLLHPGHLGRDRGHQQGGEQRRASPRHADAHALDGGHLLSQDDPVPVLHEPGVAALAPVEGTDVGGGLLQGAAQVLLHCGGGLFKGGRGDAKPAGGQLHPVELAGERGHRLVAALPHLLEHAGNRLLHLGREAAVAREDGLQPGRRGLGRVGDDLEHQ